MTARFAGDAPPRHELGAKTPVCYAGRELYDIVIDTRSSADTDSTDTGPGDASLTAYSLQKIGGNAQRRFRKTIFQHGSIPIILNRDGLTEIFPRRAIPPVGDIVSLSELHIGTKTRVAADRDQFVHLLRDSFQEFASAALRTSETRNDDLSENERHAAEKLEQSVYLSDDWTFNRKRVPGSVRNS